MAQRQLNFTAEIKVEERDETDIYFEQLQMSSRLIKYTKKMNCVMWYELYLTTESYHFCLFCIEEGKMDQLFLEAEGNRRIANQIAQRAFLARQDVLPTGQKVASSFAYCLGRLNCTRDMFWHLFFPVL